MYHHLHISNQSIHIPRDRSLKITIDNTIYTMTPKSTDTTPTQHTIYLFFNPYEGHLSFNTLMMEGATIRVSHLRNALL